MKLNFQRTALKNTWGCAWPLQEFWKAKGPQGPRAPTLSEECNYSWQRSDPSEDKFSEPPVSCIVALLPAALLQTRFQPVPPHCTMTGALLPLFSSTLTLPGSSRDAFTVENPAKLWNLTAQRNLWVCWKVWHYPLKWNIFEAVAMSKALIPRLMWENTHLPQNFLFTWTVFSLSWLTVVGNAYKTPFILLYKCH